MSIPRNRDELDNGNTKHDSVDVQTLAQTSQHSSAEAEQCKDCLDLEKRLEENEREINERLVTMHKKSENTTALKERLQDQNKQFEAFESRILGGRREKKPVDDVPLAKLNAMPYEKWQSVCESLKKDFPQRNELDRLSFVSDIIMKTYNRCLEFADRQMRAYLLYSLTDILPREIDLSKQKSDEISMPSRNLLKEAYETRRQIGQTEGVRSQMKQNVFTQVKEDLCLDVETHCTQLRYLSLPESTKAEIDDFMKEFADCCWLMEISKTRRLLDFDVLGQVYCGEIERRFSEHRSVESSDNPNGYILAVVWPSVVTEARGRVIQKGTVITAAGSEINTEI